jgi:hypothetical protein
LSKISQLAAITSVKTDDLLLVVDIHDTSMAATGTDKQMTLSQLPFAGKPQATDCITYVSINGSDSNDGLSWGSAFATIGYAISVLPANGGWIWVGAGTFPFSTQLSLNGLRNITISGVGGRTGGAGAGTILSYSGTAASFITAQSTTGIRLLDLYIEYTSTSFTGNLVDARNVSGGDTAYFLLDNCILTGAGTSSAAALVALDKCNSSEIASCAFNNAQVAILGRSAAGYSNSVRIRNNGFVNLVTCPIMSSGQSWLIDGNTFEPLQNGAAAAYSNSAGTAGNSVTFLSNWFGDNSNGGTWINWAGNNLVVTGNYIAGDASTTGVLVSSSSCFGIEIASNDFNTLLNAVNLGTTSGHTNFAVMFNTYTSVTNKVAATTWPTGGIHYDGANFRIGNCQLTGSASGSGYGVIYDAQTSGDTALSVRGGQGLEVIHSGGLERLKLDTGVALMMPGTPVSTTSSLATPPPAVVFAKNAITVTLPTPSSGYTIFIKNTDSANSVTLATSSGLIDNASTLVLTALQGAVVTGDGANWWVMVNR